MSLKSLEWNQQSDLCEVLLCRKTKIQRACRIWADGEVSYRYRSQRTPCSQHAPSGAKERQRLLEVARQALQVLGP